MIDEYATKLPALYFSQVQELINALDDNFLKPVLQVTYVDALTEQQDFELALQVLQDFPNYEEKKENLANVLREFYLSNSSHALTWIRAQPVTQQESYFKWLIVELYSKYSFYLISGLYAS